MSHRDFWARTVWVSPVEVQAAVACRRAGGLAADLGMVASLLGGGHMNSNIELPELQQDWGNRLFCRAQGKTSVHQTYREKEERDLQETDPDLAHECLTSFGLRWGWQWPATGLGVLSALPEVGPSEGGPIIFYYLHHSLKAHREIALSINTENLIKDLSQESVLSYQVGKVLEFWFASVSNEYLGLISRDELLESPCSPRGPLRVFQCMSKDTLCALAFL